jgi:hypothetical protein
MDSAMPRVRVPRHLAGCLALMLLASCESTTATCDCLPLRYQAVVYGRVTNAAGAPVQAARIVAELGAPGCAQALETVGEVLTGLDGTYRVPLFASSRQPRPGDCLRAFAAAPAGSTLRGSDTVSFAVGFGAEEVVDSTRVNLVLRAP